MAPPPPPGGGAGGAPPPHDRVAVALPLHWQSLVWLLAAWSVGAVETPVLPRSVSTSSVLKKARVAMLPRSS